MCPKWNHLQAKNMLFKILKSLKAENIVVKGENADYQFKDRLTIYLVL